MYRISDVKSMNWSCWRLLLTSKSIALLTHVAETARFVCVLVAVTSAAMASGRDSSPSSTLAAAWGGEHIGLIVTERGATLEYDCALGTIDEQVRTDQGGQFEVRGTHMFERGGPGRAGDPPLRQHPALYRGWTNGKEMRLTVTLVDTGVEVGRFSLEVGRRPALEKCL